MGITVQRRPTYIREWRKHRGLSLRELSARINAQRPAPFISYASLTRIERGLQPYSQDTLEAISAALDVEPAILIAHDPGAAPAITSLWAQLNDQQRPLAIALLQALLQFGNKTPS